MTRKTDVLAIVRLILPLILVLLVLGAPAGAADSLQKGAKDKIQDQADEALSNIKQYCAASLGPGYSLSVQKTYNGGYLFICSQVGDENGKETTYPQLVQEDRYEIPSFFISQVHSDPGLSVHSSGSPAQHN